MKLSILIPCYNEKETILELLRRVHAVPLGRWEREVIVVDDGSTDGSRAILERARGMPNTAVFFHGKNKGKGAALAEALRHATGEYVIVQDADLELIPEEIVRLLQKAEQGASAVYGTRNVGENPHPNVFAAWGVRFLTWMMNRLYDTHLTDVWNGFKLVRRNLLHDTPFRAGGFESEILFTAALARRGVRIEEAPVSYFPRSKGEKKITYVDGLKTIFLLLCDRIGITRNSPRSARGMRRFLPQGFFEYAVFFGTFIAGIVFFVAANAVNGEKLWTEGISTDYAVLAKNLYAHGVFSESIAPPFFPASTRTPLFPVVLGFFWLIGGMQWIAAYIGMQILNAFLSLVFFRFARTLFRSNGVSLLATAIFALEPVRLYSTITTYPEILLLLLLVCGLLMTQRFISARQPRFLYAAAILWGLTPLVRPVTLPLLLPLFILPFALLRQWKGLWRKCAVSAITLVLFAFPAASWMARNFTTFGQFALSSLPEHQLAGVIVPYFMAWKAPCEGCGQEEAIVWWRDRIAAEIIRRSPTGEFASRAHVDLTDAPMVRAVALPYLTDNLFAFARFMAPQALFYPFIDSWRSVAHNVFGIAPRAQFPISFPARLAHGEWSVLREAFILGKDNTLIVFIAGKATAALLMFFSVVGAVIMVKRRIMRPALCGTLLFLFFFFSGLAVPTYELRYRVYILPFLALFGAAGISALWKRDVI